MSSSRYSIRFGTVLLTFLAGIAASQPATDSESVPQESAGSVTVALTGGRLIDGYGGPPVDDAVILISGNRISAVGPADRVDVPDADRVLDFRGMSVLPGLWESHGHLFHIGGGKPAEFQRLFAPETKEVMAAVAKVSLMAGITSFRDTGGPLDVQLELREEIEAGRMPGPRLFLAGPIFHQAKPGESGSICTDASCREVRIASPRDAERAVENLLRLGADQIKVYGFWDEELLETVTSTAHHAGVGVDADVRHPRAYLTAVKAGVDRLHHVFAADPLSDYSDTDLRTMIAGWKPAGTGPSANIIRGPWIIPTVEMRQAYVRVFNFPGLLDHPRLREQYSLETYAYLRETWEHPWRVPWGIGAPERVEVVKEKLRAFVEAGGREQLVAGTDAGSPFNLHSPLPSEIGHLHDAGLTAMEAIQAATLRAAQMQGVEEELGTISPGKYADLVIVDGDPLQDISLLRHRIVAVVKDGELYFPDRNWPGGRAADR